MYYYDCTYIFVHENDAYNLLPIFYDEISIYCFVFPSSLIVYKCTRVFFPHSYPIIEIYYNCFLDWASLSGCYVSVLCPVVFYLCVHFPRRMLHFAKCCIYSWFNPPKIFFAVSVLIVQTHWSYFGTKCSLSLEFINLNHLF